MIPRGTDDQQYSQGQGLAAEKYLALRSIVMNTETE
jgi:hypothetical protein